MQTSSLEPPSKAYKSVAFSERFAGHLDKRGARGGVSRAVTASEALMLAQRLRDAGVPVADDPVIAMVHAHNRQVIRLAVRDGAGEPGFLAYLPLRPAGFDALAHGCLDRRAPDLALLCREGEPPAAVYLWCIYSPGQFMPAMSAVVRHFDEIAPGGVPVFTSAATPHAAKLFAALGFVGAHPYYPEAEPDLLTLVSPEVDDSR